MCGGKVNSSKRILQRRRDVYAFIATYVLVEKSVDSPLLPPLLI